MLIAWIRGFALGFLGGIPVGPVNAAVMDTALRRCFLRAFAVGLGGAFVDFLYSQLAFAGLVTMLQGAPRLSNLLLGLGGVALIAFGVFTARNAAVDAAPAAPRAVGRDLARAFATGMMITALNPAALVSWVLLAGTVLADLTRLQGLVAGAGIFVGTAVWFLGIAWLATRGRVRLGQRAVWVTRTVGALLIIYGVFLVGKASVTVWAAVAMVHP